MGSLGEEEKKNNERKQNEKQPRGKKGAKEKDGEIGEGRRCKRGIKQREKNNESSERQECFNGNIFQENEESNITLRKRVICKMEWV